MLEREKVLPSFIMAVDYKIFDKLYQLAEMEDARITSALQNLFLQLPTDSEILEAIEIFSFQVSNIFFVIVCKKMLICL